MTGNVQITTLGNGCRVVTAEMPSVESISLCFDAGVGGRHEKTGERGFSHFLEHMLFKGSEKRRTTRAVSQPLEARGGTINAFTSASHTCFFASAPFDAARLAFDIIGDIFAHPIFPPREIDRERRVVLEEIKMYHDDDAAFVQDLAQEALWPGHPLGRPILGTPESLAKADRASLLDYHRKHYTSSGTIVAAAGRIKHETAVALAESLTHSLETSRAPGFVPASRAKAPVELVFEERETQQVQLVAAFRALNCTDERRAALAVLSHILGRGLTSRLFMTLREKHGLVYSVGTDVSSYADGGSFQIFAGIDPVRAVQAASLLAKELKRIADEPVPGSELRRSIGALVGAVRMTGETSASQMSWILDKTRKFGRVESSDEVISAFKSVQPTDVSNLAAEIFRRSGMSLALVVPRGGPAKPCEILSAMSL